MFHTDDEAAAWRVIGIAGRACYELGLHRREILNQSFSSQEDSNLAVKMFWVVYALDRRWAFGSGMPFAIQDADVDETLPEPVCCPYFQVLHPLMFLYSRTMAHI